jgi:hypothetical protein
MDAIEHLTKEAFEAAGEQPGPTVIARLAGPVTEPAADREAA